MNTNFKSYYAESSTNEFKEMIHKIFQFKEWTEQPPFGFVWRYKSEKDFFEEHSLRPLGISVGSFLFAQMVDTVFENWYSISLKTYASDRWYMIISAPDYKFTNRPASRLKSIRNFSANYYSNTDIVTFISSFMIINYNQSLTTLLKPSMEIEEGKVILDSTKKNFELCYTMNHPEERRSELNKIAKQILDDLLKLGIPRGEYIKMMAKFGLLDTQNMDLKDTGYLF